jgi:hypothetical protein
MFRHRVALVAAALAAAAAVLTAPRPAAAADDPLPPIPPACRPAATLVPVVDGRGPRVDATISTCQDAVHLVVYYGSAGVLYRELTAAGEVGTTRERLNVRDWIGTVTCVSTGIPALPPTAATLVRAKDLACVTVVHTGDTMVAVPAPSRPPGVNRHVDVATMEVNPICGSCL